MVVLLILLWLLRVLEGADGWAEVRNLSNSDRIVNKFNMGLNTQAPIFKMTSKPEARTKRTK